MAFFTPTKTNRVDTLYIMRIWLDEEDTVVHKIGVTNRGNPIDRLLEILRSIYKNARYIPRADIKRFRKVDKMFEKEAMLHRHFKDYHYRHMNRFDGDTEMFIGIDEEYLLWIYEECAKGLNVDDLKTYEGLACSL